MCKLSFVLPIYNVESYLQECIDSIAGQPRFEECEILLIDDGSDDGSATICDMNSSTNPRIYAYHKTNGGLSDARNYGLARARGKYVVFVDSDDYLNSGAIDTMLDSVEEKKVDVLLLDAVCVNEDGTRIRKPDFEFRHRGLEPSILYDGRQCISAQLCGGVLQTTVWLGVYCREFLLDNQLWFKKHLLHEDELWSPNVMLEAEHVLYLPVEYYSYRVRQNSIMHGVKKDNSKNIESSIYVYSHLTKYFDWKIGEGDLLDALKDDVSRRYLRSISAWEFTEYPVLMRRVDRLEILRNARKPKNILRALILICNAKIYVRLSRLWMKL